ncbi:MAG: hypothetical protein HUU47_10540 [Bacteroidetes bacterium]|nr:hypothetical protein [Bacteroidota bacterium]
MKSPKTIRFINISIIITVALAEIIVMLPSFAYYLWPSANSILICNKTYCASLYLKCFLYFIMLIVIIVGNGKLIFLSCKKNNTNILMLRIMRIIKTSNTDITSLLIYFFLAINISLMNYYLQPRVLDYVSPDFINVSSPVQFLFLLCMPTGLIGVLRNNKEPEKITESILICGVSFMSDYNENNMSCFIKEVNKNKYNISTFTERVLTGHDKFIQSQIVISPISQGSQVINNDKIFLYYGEDNKPINSDIDKLLTEDKSMFNDKILSPQTNVELDELKDGYISWGKWDTIRMAIDSYNKDNGINGNFTLKKIVLLYSKELCSFRKFIDTCYEKDPQNKKVKYGKYIDPEFFVKSYLHHTGHTECEIELIKSENQKGLNFNEFNSVDSALTEYLEKINKEEKKYELVFNIMGGTTLVTASMAIRSMPRNRKAIYITQDGEKEVVKVPVDKYTASELWDELIESKA